MQSRPIDDSQRVPANDSNDDATTTHHGLLHHGGSNHHQQAALGLESSARPSGSFSSSIDQASVDLSQDDAAGSGDERATTTGLNGRSTGKRTPSPVDRIIEHEKASPKITSKRNSLPAFRVISRSKNAPAPRVSLHDLPAEVLTHVCSYLPADAFSSMSLVSKKVHQIVTGEHAWRMAFARYFPGHEALNENPTVKLDRIGEEVLASEKRYFTRLTAFSSWRSEYIVRTRMLRALTRGSPSEIDNLTSNYNASRAHTKSPRVGQMDFDGGLHTPITKIVGSFTMQNNRPQVRLLHASKEECQATMSRPLESNKYTNWGFELPPLQFSEVQPGVEMYGLGPGEVVGVPNSLDISPIYGLIVVDGMPGGRIYHRQISENRGVYLSRSSSDGAAERGVPRVNENRESMTAVWVAKESNVPEMSNGMICALVGSSAGIVTACALGNPLATTTARAGGRDVSARWVLSPGVPIVAFAVDESFTARRLGQKRAWAFAMNALGEVFCLKGVPQYTLPSESPRNPSDWDINVMTWEAGQSVHWDLVEPTRRVAKPDPFGDALADASYSPRSSSLAHGLSTEQLASETKEIEAFMQKPPIHFRSICHGWDMQRQLEVDFAGDDGHGAGEAVFVITTGQQEGLRASVTRYTRQMIEDVVATSPTKIATEDPPQPPKPAAQVSTSLFGGSEPAVPAKSAWAVHRPANIRRISYSSESETTSQDRFEVWRASNLSFGGLKAVSITAVAKDESVYANFTIDEDPLLSLNPIPTTWSPIASPVGRRNLPGQATDIPGQRARLFAVGTKIGSVLIWNMRAPTSNTAELVNDVEPVRIIHTDSPGISSLALSALYVVHGGSDGLVQAWDPLAHEKGPLRTIHSKFAQKARRDLRINQARPAGIGLNYYAASALCIDPDAKVLRGVVSIGTHLRYWSYSSGSAGSYPGSKRRSQRDRKLPNANPDPKITRTGRGVLADYIANEQAELESLRRNAQKEAERANARYGLDLLGEGATEDELLAYATMISEEAHANEQAKRASTGSSSFAGVSDIPTSPPQGSSSFTEASDHEDVQLARALQSEDKDLAEALERSILDSEAMHVPDSETGSDDLGFTVKFAKPKKGRRSPKGKSPTSAGSPAVGGSSRGHEQDDLEYALQISLAEEQSRRELEEDFPSLRKTPSPSWSASSRDKGKGKARS